MRKRVRLAIAAALTIGTFVLVAGASAVPAVLSEATTDHPLYRLDNSLNDSTQMTNIPVLAWRGETLRLVKCYPFLNGDAEAAARTQISQTGGLQSLFDIKFVIEDWSGDAVNRPVFLNGNDGNRPVFFGEGEQEGSLCASIHITSQKAGIALVKLNAEVFGDLARYLLFPDDIIALQHQFVAIWMNANQPTLLNVSGGTGAPAGPITDVAGDEGNVLQAVVTGSVPNGNNFAELGLADELTFPEDWPDLAEAYATSTGFDDNGDFDPSLEFDPRLWDIHDDNTATPDVHVPGYCALPSLTTLIDQVDNCIAGNDEDEDFSRVFGDNAGDFSGTVGPFDALRPDDTLLSDGKIDAWDAPMPPIRIDFEIEPNTGAPTDISGVGSLVKVDKDDVYVRNPLLADDTAHNLYAPFYKAYIPARAAEYDIGTTASGTDGAFINNNFAGYLADWDEPYDFWDIAESFNEAAGGDTDCLLRSDEDPAYRQLPAGDQGVVVYTDEHGEARVRFLPGTGFYFDNLGVVVNLNDGCDLQGVNPIGTADITATARHPGQRTTAPAQRSAELRKIVTSLFNKTIVCVPKGGTGVSTTLVRICTATAIDIDGEPFVGEVVCFTAETLGGLIPGPGYVAIKDPVRGLNRLCIETDENGQAAVEVITSSAGLVNVIAHFVDENLFRSVNADFRPTAPSTTTPNPTTPTTPSTNVPTPTQVAQSVSPSASQASVVSLTNSVTPVTAKPAVAAKAAKANLSTARLVLVNGKRHLMVRVNGTSKTAKIRIIQVNKAGKVVSRTTRIVATNKQVRVGKMVIGKNIKTVRVSVL